MTYLQMVNPTTEVQGSNYRHVLSHKIKRIIVEVMRIHLSYFGGSDLTKSVQVFNHSARSLSESNPSGEI